MDYQKLIIVGNVARDAERKTSKKGDVAYTRFSVAVSDGREQTTFFPVTLFGKIAENLAEYITKGRQITVEGRISVGENGRFNVVADRVELGLAPRDTTAKKKQPAKSKAEKRSPSDTPDQE
jgi:single-strand DNA-binding protein